MKAVDEMTFNNIMFVSNFKLNKNQFILLII